MKRKLKRNEPATDVATIKDAPFDYRRLISLVEAKSHTSKVRTKLFGEVYTPAAVINKMLDVFPPDKWVDPVGTWLDPCAGKGNFPAFIVTRLMEGLKDIMPDESERYRHIMEKMIYMGELQLESAREIDAIFNPGGKLKLNLYVGDYLKIPEDFWDLPYEERRKKYPANKI